ncbi:alpha/beta hydrolase [Spirosoma sp. KCTC 42546]|uniref:alpha/beta hydrolase n=1 Tax=Spirosoma sp. KCTC 42546 TaxID=2520506 RepID=UPI00115BC2E8|nr:alpha/beta hydrolase [Spirosoma sp. KCTC 42546]QDK81922.1 alpha/beta hydrolase [Spirosoma sp. KCTC 42546]
MNTTRARIPYLLLAALLLPGRMMAQQEPEVPLYPNGVPNSVASTQPEKRTYDETGRLTAVSHVLVPRLIVYRAASPNGTGLIICPGGGYRNLNTENARFIAQRLNQWGITAFVLTYRLPTDGLMQDRAVGPFQDAQQALRIVRQRAAEWQLQTRRIGILGSSAGGHVAAMAATQFSKVFELGKDTTALRPDFLVLCWPVVSFRPDIAHQGSVKNLLGDHPAAGQLADYSPEEHVTAATPPTFLVHAGDDPTVTFSNSIRFYEALKKVNVPAELHLYEKGGHGFGIKPDLPDSWMTQLEIWLRNRGFLHRS